MIPIPSVESETVSGKLTPNFMFTALVLRFDFLFADSESEPHVFFAARLYQPLLITGSREKHTFERLAV